MRDWLIAMRKAAGLSQKKLADAVGIAQSSYNGIETGKRNPRVGTAKQIAAVLGCSWQRFYDDAETERSA